MPGTNINVFNLSLYSPQLSDTIIGCLGPATKGPVNQLIDITDEGNYQNIFGRPKDGMYAPRASTRAAAEGDQFKFARIAGKNLATSRLTLYAADGKTPVLIVTAASPGSWANEDITIAVTHNGTESYNLYVYFLGQLVEPYVALDNGNVETNVNASTRIQIALAPAASTTFPAETVDAVTGQLLQKSMSGGDDGCFAKTDSIYSSTGGVSGKRFHGKMDAVGGSRVWRNIRTITAALAGKSMIYGSVGMAVVPGTFTVRIQTAGGPTFIELADNGALSYAPGAAGVGILAPSAGAHVGYIDYRTGAWGVKLAVGTAFLSGTIDGIWTRANTESVGATEAGVGSYAGNLSDGPLGVGYFSVNRMLFTFSVAEQVGVPTAGATAANSDAGLKSLAGWVVPGTVVLTPAHTSSPVPTPVYDDGFGGFRTSPAGAGAALTGAINYRTGAWSVTWDVTGPAMPASGTLTAAYDIQVLDMGGGAVAGPNGTFVLNEVDEPSHAGGLAVAAYTDVGAQTIRGPIVRGSLHIDISATSAGPFRAYDNGTGGWLSKPRGDPAAVAVVGSIDYDSGQWTVTIPAGTITAAATVKTTYVSVAGDKSNRALRGMGPQALGAGGFNAAGMDLADPVAANSFNGPNWLDHTTGQFAVKLDLVPLGVGTQSFDLKEGGAIQAVYIPATILGFGDNAAVIYAGTLNDVPFRRQANRLVAFQAAQASAAGVGDPQVSFSALGAAPGSDYWTENVALSTDPDNKLNYATGVVSVKWTGAPTFDEAVFVVGEEVVIHAVCKYPGDIGNERATLTTGFYIAVLPDTSLVGSLKLQVLFNSVVQETFGQALSIDSLIAKVNNATTGSKLITVTATVAAGFILVDTDATQNCGLSGAFTQADVIGAKVGSTYTGLQIFSNSETVDINWLIVPGQWHKSVINAIKTLCEKPRRRCQAICPMPDLNDALSFRDFVNGSFNAATPGGVARPTVTVPYPPTVAIDSSQLAAFYSWVDYFDQASNKSVREPSDGDIAQLVAGTPAPWQAIAGGKRGRIKADDVKFSPDEDDRRITYGLVGSRVEVLNPIISSRGRLMNYGQRTMQRTSTKLDRINVRWTINVIMNAIDFILQDFVFDISDSIVWREITQALNSVVRPVVEQRGLFDAFVICDATTNTADVQNQNRVKAKVFVKPTPTAEDIDVDLIITPQGVTFADVIQTG